MRLKGENGVMRKKFNTLQKEIDTHKNEISKMYSEEKKLHTVIKSLEKDISGLKMEVLLFYSDSGAWRDHPRQGEAYLWLEEKESRIGEIQICIGL